MCLFQLDTWSGPDRCALSETTIMAPEIRYIDTEGVAKILGRSRAWFYARRRSLENIGFPRPHPIIKRYNSVLIQKWVDGQSFLSDPIEQENPFDTAFECAQ